MSIKKFEEEHKYDFFDGVSFLGGILMAIGGMSGLTQKRGPE